MRKKILLLLCSCIGLSYQMQAQSTANVNPKIAEVYGSHLNTILTHDPQRLTVLNQLLNERISIVELDMATAQDKFPALYSQPLFDKYAPGLSVDASYNASTFNPLKYDLPFFSYGDAGYWINGTNKVLMIKGLKNYYNQ